MIGYLVRSDASLPPFSKPASQIRLHRETVGSRVRAQLSALTNGAVQQAEDLEGSTVRPGSLVVSDDVVLSGDFLKRFVEALPDLRGNYQAEVDASLLPLLNAENGEAEPRLLPVFYYGSPQGDEPVVPLRLTPDVIHQMREGLPARMHQFADMRVFFLSFYGIQLAHWFDLMTATSLYAREFVCRLIRPFHARVPERLLRPVLTNPFLMSKCNAIGKRCRIHPTAILEGCVVGDDVEIGPYCYLRSSVISDGAVLREKASVKMSLLGEGAFLMGTDVLNSYVGAESSIVTLMLYNVVFGERGFIGGGSGFADFIVGSDQIPANILGQEVNSRLKFLGSAVGDDCFLGSNLVFAPGRTIPDGTRILDHGLVRSVPHSPGGSYVVSRNQLLQVPDNFLAKREDG